METANTKALDHAEIKQVLARYCRGIDRLDRELIAGVYWDDAYDSHVSFEGRADDFVEWVLGILAKERCTAHILGQSLIDLDGDVAMVETYFNAHHVRDTADGAQLTVSVGRYIDRFERRYDEWRIARREVVLDFRHEHRMPSLGRTAQATPEHTGHHSKGDRSYALLT
jgi:hypothetical protein